MPSSPIIPNALSLAVFWLRRASVGQLHRPTQLVLKALGHSGHCLVSISWRGIQIQRPFLCVTLVSSIIFTTSGDFLVHSQTSQNYNPLQIILLT